MKPLDEYKKHLLQQELERKEQVTKKVKKARRTLLLFEFTLIILGLSIIGYHTNSWVVVGLLFLLWGNNMGVFRTIFSSAKNSLKEIWK
jgi:hypothetical protein